LSIYLKVGEMICINESKTLTTIIIMDRIPANPYDLLAAKIMIALMNIIDKNKMRRMIDPNTIHNGLRR